MTSSRSPRARVVSLALAALLTACAGGRDGTGLVEAGRAEILWDTWGIPHIFANQADDLFYAFGWAQAHSHGDRLLRLLGESRGRGAEYWGEEQLALDRWLQTMGAPALAERWLAAQEPEFRAHLEAFVSGINDYARAHPDRIADDVEVVLPVVPVDVMAHNIRGILFTFVVGPDVVRAAEGYLASTATPDAPGAASRPGSNAWAVAPRRSASGNALLLANPHLPWSGVFTWYEAQLVAPGVDVYGATLIGSPILGIAFNERLGWTHTVNTLDGADLYELRLVDHDEGPAYLWDGEPRPFEVEEVALRVRLPANRPDAAPDAAPGGPEDGGADVDGDGGARASTGTLAGDDTGYREERFSVLRSVHGPVIARDGDRAVALRVVGTDRPRMLEQHWNMGTANDLLEFRDAIRELQLPMFTIMYADGDGHILHVFNGNVPVRPDPAGGSWSAVVPGHEPATLWTTYHPYPELPRLLDPRTGWLQNANDPPWTTTLPLEASIRPDDHPAYMAPRTMHFRAQRSARMLHEDDSVSFDELVAYKHSTRVESADHLVDDWVAAARESGDALAVEAATVLEAWDRATDAGSRGAVLYAAAVEELARRAGGLDAAFATPWSRDDPLGTPRGLADPTTAVAALREAAVRVVERHGDLAVAWGEVHRVRGPGVDLPGNGATDPLGVFRAARYARDDDRRRRLVGGDSYVAAIEFSDPVRARALLGYGNASQPGSPHAGDQLPLFADRRLRPVWRTREEIEANLESREVF